MVPSRPWFESLKQPQLSGRMFKFLCKLVRQSMSGRFVQIVNDINGGGKNLRKQVKTTCLTITPTSSKKRGARSIKTIFLHDGGTK